jgi:hypothetical protein
MLPLTTLQLLAVTGGKTETIGPDGTYTFQQAPYETCVDAMVKGANEKYPDKRWFFEPWFGVEDKNAGPRADYARDAVRTACGPAPAS